MTTRPSHEEYSLGILGATPVEGAAKASGKVPSKPPITPRDSGYDAERAQLKVPTVEGLPGQQQLQHRPAWDRGASAGTFHEFDSRRGSETHFVFTKEDVPKSKVCSLFLAIRVVWDAYPSRVMV